MNASRDPQPSCEIVREHLGAHIDGELTGPRPVGGPTPSPEAIERHLEVCPDCEELARGLRRDWELLDHWPISAPPVDGAAFLGRVQARIESDRRRTLWRVRTVASIAAALLLFALAFPYLAEFSGLDGPSGDPDVGLNEVASAVEDLEDETLDELVELAGLLQAEELADLLPEPAGNGSSAGYKKLLEEFLIEELEGERS